MCAPCLPTMWSSMPQNSSTKAPSPRPDPWCLADLPRESPTPRSDKKKKPSSFLSSQSHGFHYTNRNLCLPPPTICLFLKRSRIKKVETNTKACSLEEGSLPHCALGRNHSNQCRTQKSSQQSPHRPPACVAPPFPPFPVGFTASITGKVLPSRISKEAEFLLHHYPLTHG